MGSDSVIGRPADRVAVVTGSRAEFGLLERTLTLLKESPWCQLAVIAAGMHLLPRTGLTIEEVEARFDVAARVKMDPPEDNRKGMALAVADGLGGFTAALAQLRPDLVLVLGDRTEVFAAALAASYLGVPVAHIHGGDLTGNPIDDFQRDTVSRLASLHLAATTGSAERLKQLGVSGRVVVVGAPGLDALVNRPLRPAQELASALGVPLVPWIVVLFHPNPAHPERGEGETRALLKAASRVASARQGFLIVVYPNNDAGCHGVLSALEPYHHTASSKTFRNLARDDYLDLLSHALLLIGNSSSGIIESATLGLAVVNVGDRQQGRERDANVIDCPPTEDDIVCAAHRALTDIGVKEAVASRASVYGCGQASRRIVGALRDFLASEPHTPVTRSWEGIHAS